MLNVRSKRQKQGSKILNDVEEIQKKRNREVENRKKNEEKENRKRKSKKAQVGRPKKIKKTILKNKRKGVSCTNEESGDTLCCECKELYSLTRSSDDWIQCISCKKWLHENCTSYENYCNKCH